MTLWLPPRGETLLARAPVVFASGAAMRVRGKRWFRDTERKDIQGQLPGWPEGPVYTARSAPKATALNTLKGTAIAAVTLAWGALSSQGGSVGGPSGGTGADISDDRADEVEDFPVIWAAPDTTARTLPWQLDPGRSSPDHYRTHAVVTDRRLVIVGFPYVKGDDTLIDDEPLWEIGRSGIKSVELRDFKVGNDVKIVFTDGSWGRFSSVKRERLTRYLIEPLDFIPLGSLTTAQRETAERFASTRAPDSQAPLVKRNACGCFRIEVIAPSTVDAFFGHSGMNTVMNTEGTELELTEYHPDDFLT
ncbi:hypothetical protein [Streptomyces sp. MH60]|uniref:hypothetical protein n=1 Tax=Streptomyces sp. MH60 TaxID=1940758 RepID=UPI000CEE0988|nr:hypothetical protein [Streptomyces sp. MH60]PPS87894.1 hypothetical protein BZZ08_02593 [Streptomyces sp. MH60]